ncbi:MAG TPA: hypothetical protein VKV15_07205 [Bryobacteraceae bacterium]|nr:hypothetical protein [Bryobacteraceae bacterium]
MAVNDRSSQREVPAIARAILRYLLQNPDAKDSVDGIRRWWLPASFATRSQDEVEQAAKLMVGMHFLQCRSTVMLADIYWLNRNARDRIERFVEEESTFEKEEK